MTNDRDASPYSGLPARAFWKSGVADRAAGDPGDLYQPKFPISQTDRFVTAGSCFAQHVGRWLRRAGVNVLDAEPLPGVISAAVAGEFGFRLYSARYGNIYTVRQLLQLLREASGDLQPAMPVWERDGRFYDAQRPNVEPGGFASAEQVMRHRAHHLKRVDAVFRAADVVVFTFGLTEAWVHRETGTVYPTAPGTIAGAFDPEAFAFRNFDMFEVLEDFLAFRALMQQYNPDIRFIVTVSPVPLTATASGDHVEVATSHSKAVLRAVCGKLAADHADIDYFPSYEVITSQTVAAGYFMPNLRSVSSQGVETAMGLFMDAHGLVPAEPEVNKRWSDSKRGGGTGAVGKRAAKSEGEICEDVLLEAFSK